MGVGEEFTTFKDKYNIGRDLISSISTRSKRITARLNMEFRSLVSDTSHSYYVGSYGRDTAAAGISDLDMAYILPTPLYHRFNTYAGNGQSALLQLMKTAIQKTYPTSDAFGDGQVVVIQFTDGLTFEILPVFVGSANTWIYPNANDGGSWKSCNPKAEIAAIAARNSVVNHNLKHLCRMMRVWRDHNSVPMSGALIDTLAYQFIENWEYRDKSFLYHDFMARDFLHFLSTRDKTQTYWRMPGSASYVGRKGAFEYKAAIDHPFSVAACTMCADADGTSRRAKWRTVFGPTFPS